MDGTRAVCVALLAVAELGGGCSGRKAEPPPSREAPAAPPPQAASALDTGAPAASPADAAPIDAAVPPDPIASLFRRHYTPDESLSDRMQRRIRYHLRGKTKAPIALHHITYIPQVSSGGDVFAIYEYSVHEDCVAKYADRKEARENCTVEPTTISDVELYGRDKFAMAGYPETQYYLNKECVTVGAVRARFEPPGPDVPADAGGALTIWSAKLDGLCEVRNYNRLFVADLDGDERLEMYLDVTTSEEKLNRESGVRSEPDITTVGHRFQRHLYLFAGDDSNGMALSLELGDWEDTELQPEELVELRDINRDRRLDVIQRELCTRVDTSGGASSDQSCDGKPREKTEYVYDAQRDAWTRMQDASDGAKVPANGSAKAPANGSVKAPADGSAKAPASDGAKVPANDGAKAPADGSAKVPASGSAKAPAVGGAAPP